MPTRVTFDASDLEARLQEELESMAMVLDRVGERTVELLQSYVGGRTRDGRLKHPGGWADRTGGLADSYDYEVTSDGGRWRLTILNTARHAGLVEALDGYFVVRGITEPGGPVQTALAQAVQELAPGWSVR